MSEQPKGFGQGKWGEGPSQATSQIKLNQVIVPEHEAKAVLRHLQVIVGQLDTVTTGLAAIAAKLEEFKTR